MEDSKRNLLISVLGLVTLVLIVTNIFFYNKVKTLRANPQIETQAQNQAEVEKLVSDVGKLISLPTNEAPTIATVTDPEKLTGQPFFANAKVGDKVLIYAATRKAILYSPSENKIIEVAPLIIGDTTTPDTSTIQPTPTTAQ